MHRFWHSRQGSVHKLWATRPMWTGYCRRLSGIACLLTFAQLPLLRSAASGRRCARHLLRGSAGLWSHCALPLARAPSEAAPSKQLRLCSSHQVAMVAARKDDIFAHLQRWPEWESITWLTIERALLWGCIRHRAWPPQLIAAMIRRAGCYYGIKLALHAVVCGYPTVELQRRYAHAHHQDRPSADPLRRQAL